MGITGQKENGSYEEEHNLIYRHRRYVNLLAVLAVGWDSGAGPWSRGGWSGHVVCFDSIRKSPRSGNSLRGLGKNIKKVYSLIVRQIERKSKMKLNKLVSTLDMDHETWLQYRKKGIGGSDAGSICGLNPYSTAISVFQDKTQLQVEEKTDNEAMRQGRDLEEYVARRFTEETGKKVRRANAIFYQEENPFMLANVDRLIVGENAGLECKTASAYSADKWKDGHIPESYEIQCHHYMAVTGADAWYIACVVLGKEFIWRKIERDEETIQMLIRIESEFWNNNVLANKMPAPDGSKAAEELLSKYYKNSDPGKSIALVGFDEKLRRRDEISELQDKLEKEKKQIEQEVKVYMEDAEKADSDHYSVSWKSVTSNRVDSKKLKSVYPEVYQECVKASESRRFTVKEIA